MGEFEKYQELKEKGKQMQEDYERQLEEMEEKMEHTLAEFTDVYEARLNEMMILLGRVRLSFLRCRGFLINHRRGFIKLEIV